MIYTLIEVQRVLLKTLIITNQTKDNKNRHKNKRILRNDRKDRNITPNLTVKNNIE